MEKKRFVIDLDKLDEGEDARVYWDDQNIIVEKIDDFTVDTAEEEPEDPELEKWVDAIVSLFPYSKTECYTRINAYYAIRKSVWNTDARELVTSIKKGIKFLPNPKKDAASFLRNEFERIKHLFEECPQCEVVFEYSRGILVNFVLSDTWDDIWWDLESLKKESTHEYPAKDEILIWDEFWEKAEPILDSYLKPLGYLATLKWLQLYIHHIENSNHPTNIETGKNNQVKLSHRQIAILCHYQDITVDSHNQEEIALANGWSKPTSGQSIYMDFCRTKSKNDRTAQGKNVVNDIEVVLGYLRDIQKKDAKIIRAIRTAEDELIKAKENNLKK
ncbi:hypothetical protein ACFPMF_07360 [Larkinella bovis]|uniref:Uncharacterized protein n=1 Tax=Larkinella bovis TaxID=683041 RepID=A0ABW0ICQ2_9BACT